MASSIPSMPASTSSTNNRPLSLSSSSAPMSLFNNNLGPEKSQSLNFTTKTATDKIKNAHHLQHHQQQLQLQFQQLRPPHEDPSNPINFSAAAKLFSPFANSPFFSQQQNQQLQQQQQSIATAAGLHYNSLAGAAAAAGPPNLRRDRRLRKSSASTTAFRSVRKPSTNITNDIDHAAKFYGFHESFMNNRIGMVGPSFKSHERQLLESKIPIERQLNLSPPGSKKSPPNYEHLKWEDHVSTTVSAIQSLLHNETFVDVTLVCDIEENDDESERERGPWNHVNEAAVCDGEEQNQALIENETKEKNNNKVDKISRSRCNDDAGGCKDTEDDPHDASSTDVASEAEAENKCTADSKSSAEVEEKQMQNVNESKPKPAHAEFKAHKVILSTCSEYFCRIFSENPCKHPVIVLKDFQPWEVKAILDFMYKGQVTLKPEHLETLFKAAEALQIRGLKEVIEKSQEWKQRKVTSPSPQSSGSKHSPKSKSSAVSDDGGEHMVDEEEKHVEARASGSAEFSDDDGESRISKCLRPRPRRGSNDLVLAHKYSKRKPNKLRSHEMKSILKYDDDEDVDDEDYHDDDEFGNDNGPEDEDGPSSPKLLNLSMGSGHQRQFVHQEGLLLRSSLSISTRRGTTARRRLSSDGGDGEETMTMAVALDGSPVGENVPQTASEREQAAGDSFQRNMHNHHGQTNPSASPPFPRRKQARPRRRSGDFVAQDLRTTPLSGCGGGEGGDYGSLYQQHLFPPSHDDVVDPQLQQQRHGQSVHGGNEVLDFTIGNNNNNNTAAKRDPANERLLLPSSSQVNNFLANHFLKTWSSSTSGGSRTDSPTVQSPHHPLLTATPSPLKREVDSEDLLLSPPVDNYHSRPGTPDTSSPPLSDIHKPVLRRRRDRFAAHRRRNHNNQRGGGGGFHSAPGENDHLGPFRNSIPSPTAAYFHALNNGHPPHRSHLSSGHNSDPESGVNHLGTQSPSTPPKSFSPLGFPLSLSGAGAAGLHQNAANSGSPWPGLPLGPPPIFGRHRAQHSAPRGGPPRAWSNADLTEALHNVWNKKMTTSQASRIFGIPYNSLLMYVRGKYGKSLKLDVLKKGLDMAMLEKANNANGNGSGNSSSGTTSSGTGNRSSTPSNNNNNNQSNKSKSHSAVDSPPLSMSINSLMGGDRGERERGEREHNNIINSNSATAAEGGGSTAAAHQQSHSHSGNNNNSSGSGRNDPQDIIPSGFNPFSIFGEYPPPFPFSNAAAAAAALSHILPPPPTASSAAAANHLGIGVGGGASDRQHEKGSAGRHRHHHRGSSDIDK